MDTHQQLAAIVESAVAAEPGSVTPTTDLSELAGWDSMSVVFVIGEVGLHWPDVRLSADDVRACRTVSALAALVER